MRLLPARIPAARDRSGRGRGHDAAWRHAANDRAAEIIRLPLEPVEDDLQDTAGIAGHARTALIADLLEQVGNFAAPDAFDGRAPSLG